MYNSRVAWKPNVEFENTRLVDMGQNANYSLPIQINFRIFEDINIEVGVRKKLRTR